jgi:hypothetical protein
VSNKEQTPDAATATSADGYAFTGPTLDLGALMADGAPQPHAQIKIPLAMMNRHGLHARPLRRPPPLTPRPAAAPQTAPEMLKDLPRTRQSLPTLAAFRPWGVSAG